MKVKNVLVRGCEAWNTTARRQVDRACLNTYRTVAHGVGKASGDTAVTEARADDKVYWVRTEQLINTARTGQQPRGKQPGLPDLLIGQ